MDIRNWKLVEIKGKFEILAPHSPEWLDQKLRELGIPRLKNITGLNRKETWIDWEKMFEYYRFFFDCIDWEERITNFFLDSKLKNTSHLIISYGWDEPVIKISTKLFIEDWEGFIRSTLYETIIFSEDYKLIIEISRDYCLHSNFRIIPKKYEKELDCD